MQATKKMQGQTTSPRQRARCHVLAPVSEHEEEEVNAVDVVQDVVEITVDSGAAKRRHDGGGQRKSPSRRRRYHAGFYSRRQEM